ncbi:hypothetical protein N0V91_005670 [Didymella pomorum]|uniref:Uncharacterized protein n=1 Tax=Didymella pomorum TaxID=749634 RepID=A0A9W8ZCD2_9PLEO|nr:hypothetical protein N0V91_005670 [Didymella pomorum]
MAMVEQWLADCDGTEQVQAVFQEEAVPQTSGKKASGLQIEAADENQVWSAYHTADTSRLNEQPDKTSTWRGTTIKEPAKTGKLRSRSLSSSSVLVNLSFMTANFVFDPDIPRSHPPVSRTRDQDTQTDTVTYWDAIITIQQYNPFSPKDVQRPQAEVKVPGAHKEAFRYAAVDGGNTTYEGREMAYKEKCRYRTARYAEVR